MRRHTPTLYTHQEQESNVQNDEHWDIQGIVPSRPHLPNTPSSASSTRARLKPQPKNMFTPIAVITTNGALGHPSSPQPSRYSDIYSQFVRRYRTQPAMEDDPRDDLDSHHRQGDLGHLIDAGDSDDEDLGHVPSTAGSTSADRFPALRLDTQPSQPTTAAQRERLEWQTMLASVLGGDVLRSEKTRIAVALDTSAEEQNNAHLNIWLGVRAKFHGRSVDEERKKLEERRMRTVDAIIEEIMTFRVDDSGPGHDSTAALLQVCAVLRRLDAAQSFYPTLKAFYADKPAARHRSFQARCDTLNTWSTVFTSLRHQLALLRRWTGSEDLDVTQPNTTSEAPIGTNAVRAVKNGSTEIADGTTFVERLLKEDSIQRTFEKGFLVTVHAFIGTARDAQVNLSSLFEEMNLPTFEKELVPLISFPTKLVQASLGVRLNYVQKLQDPEVMIVDQITEDLKLSIGLACTLKRQYEVFLTPDPGGKWNLPQCISDDYDATILEALKVFFRLIHWKLKSGVKAIYFKETDILEAQWATFNDVSLTAAGGSSLVAEQLCALINKLMVRVTNYFENQIRVPTPIDPFNRRHHDRRPNETSSAFSEQNPTSNRKMTSEQTISWYDKVLDSVRLRYRKLLRFARVLGQRFSNSAEYSLEGVPLEHFIAALVATDHILVYTHSFEEEGTYIVAPSVLRERPATIRRMLSEAFHVNEVVTDDGVRVTSTDFLEEDYDYEVGGYLLLLSPRTQFLWNGLVLLLDIKKIDFDLKDNRVRLVADGPQRRLALAKQCFDEIFVDEEGEPIHPELRRLVCIADQQAHLPAVHRELRKIARATNRLAEAIVDSVHHVRNSLSVTDGCQELLENWYLFASEHGQHAQKYMERSALHKFNRLLIGLAISWVSFICDDCDPTDRKTFKWAVNALEFALQRTKRNNILHLPDDQFEMLRQKVASCMTLLISHFDILGARSTVEAKAEKEKLEGLLRQQAIDDGLDDDIFSRVIPPEQEEVLLHLGPYAHTDTSIRVYWDKVSRSLHELEKGRSVVGAEQRTIGRVLDNEKPEDRSLVFLASCGSNYSVRWQQGRFIGAGAFGSVYLAVNLDSGSLMAVKEIKFQELAGLPNLYTQIKDELNVMEMLHHPNIVEYYGIEVHRDKVYIFEEYCQGGSLAALLVHGRIEDERIMQVYTLQMLEGLAYLHSKGIVHRDIKPDNILLDHLGVIKFVDFGAAKILAKNHRSMQRSRRVVSEAALQGSGSPSGFGGGLGMHNSLTGTPMYMSPEIIKNDKRGRHGAMDIWSLGCVVLEFATGKKPWSNLDNEWAIMFHIGVATQHPPLPEPGQISELGVNFIKQCLTIDPMLRPSAAEFMDHPWITDFREALLSYQEAENASRHPADLPETYKSASVARQATIIHEKEVETIQAFSPSTSPLETPSGSSEGSHTAH